MDRAGETGDEGELSAGAGAPLVDLERERPRPNPCPFNFHDCPCCSIIEAIADIFIVPEHHLREEKKKRIRPSHLAASP